jgi:ActR/RegA family two-component response regulator
MSEPRSAHDFFDWTRQKLTEIEATLVTLDDSLNSLKDDARKQADAAVARIRSARDSFKAQVEALRANAPSGRTITEEGFASAQLEWTKVELAYQEYVAAAAQQAAVLHAAVSARAEAQRQAWLASLQTIRASAAEALDHARSDTDAAIKRLAAETEKAKSKFGNISEAGDESWKAIKGGLEETAAAFDRTWKKIYESVSNIR